MKRIDHGFGTAGLIILASILAAVLSACLPVIKTTEGGVKVSDWLGFAGNLVGAIGTIFAGWLAWRAAMRTIEIQEELAARRERRIYDVVSDELAKLNQIYDLMWRVVDGALTREIAEYGPVVDQITDMWGTLPTADDVLVSVSKLVENLDPLKEKDFHEVVKAIRHIDAEFDKGEAAGHDGSPFADEIQEMYEKIEYASRADGWLRGVRTRLSNYVICLKKFNPDLSNTFALRTNTPVDHQNVSPVFEPLVSNFENTGKFVD